MATGKAHGKNVGPAHLANAERGARTREKILASACEVYSRKGPSNGTLNDVAAHAGLSRPSVLYHFGSADGLVLATLKAFDERHRTTFLEQIPTWRDRGTSRTL